MKSSKILALAAVMCSVSLVSGCAAGSQRSDEQVDWVTTTPAAQGEVDSITWALPQGEPASLNWLRTGTSSDNTVLSTLCESLLKQTPDGYEPALAESVETPDETTYVYHLRQGVNFSDGTEMTADDVVYSLSTQQDPAAGSYWSLYFAHVSAIEAVDRYTVRVTLTEPDVLFNQMMSTVAGTVVEKSFAESHLDAYGTAAGGVACTGPYTLDSWTSGQNIVVKANPNYWDSSNPPKVGTVNFAFITNPNTLVQGLQSGEIDGAFDFPVSAVASLRGASAGTLYLGTSTKFVDVGFTARPGPITDPAIRQAVSLALDKQAITKSLFGSAGKPTRSPFFDSVWSYSPDVLEAAYDALPDGAADVETAKKLVEGSGAAGASLKLLSNADDPSAQQLAAYIQSQVQQIGLNVDLTSMPSSQFGTASFDKTQRGQYDLVVNTSSYYDVPDPLQWAYATLTSQSPYNFIDYENADVDQWAALALRTTDGESRAELVGKISEQAFGRDFVSVNVANPANLLFMNKRITGAPATYTSHLYSPWILSVGAAQ